MDWYLFYVNHLTGELHAKPFRDLEAALARMRIEAEADDAEIFYPYERTITKKYLTGELHKAWTVMSYEDAKYLTFGELVSQIGVE